MIEINLVPGTAKRTGRRMPRLGGGIGSFKVPAFDRALALIVAGWLVGLALVGYLHASTSAELADLTAREEAGVADSIRYAAQRQQGEALRARQDSIAQKLQLIEQLDDGRFIWPHLLDEISRALPAYTWLTVAHDVAGASPPRFQLQGNAGTFPALSRFMVNLELSPFIRGVTLIMVNRATVDERIVQEFVLEGNYENPPPDAIRTEPLFAAEGGN